MKIFMRRAVVALVGLALLAAIVLAFLPQPVPVDLAAVTYGPLMITVEDDGRTRIKEKYVVSSPLTGRLLRIEMEPGDEVKAGQTVLATIEPSDPQLLDARALAEAEARLQASQAALARAETQIEQARAALEFAENDLARRRRMQQQDATSQQALEEAQLAYRLRQEEFRSAQFAREIAQYEVKQAEAALLRTHPDTSTQQATEHLEIRAPIDGRVLAVLQESAAVVTAGTSLLELGNPLDLEVVVDVLSSDAVAIRPGDRVLIEHWGGPYPLEGTVRVVEPAAFTKISALGVEEQRVNVIIDLLDPPERRPTLGDGYRVEARVVVWSADQVLRVPTGALFRVDQDQWAVFRVRQGRAERQPVQIGQRSGLSAQVLDGLVEGDQVVIHPSDRVQPGVRVEPR